jgi:hypothetical protein
MAMLGVAPLAAILVARRHRRILVTAFAVAALGVFPVLGLVPFVFQALSTVADRYAYFPMLGAAMAGAYLLVLVPRRTLGIAAAAICLGLGVLSWKQVTVWRNTLSLMGHCVMVNPRASVAYNNFGCAACPSTELQNWIRGKWQSTTRPALPPPELSEQLVEVADAYYRISFGLRPRYVDPLKNMIQIRALRGRYQEACALGEYAVKIGPTLGWDGLERVVHPYSLGWLNVQLGNHRRAAELLGYEIWLDPTHFDARMLLAQVNDDTTNATAPSMASSHPTGALHAGASANHAPD